MLAAHSLKSQPESGGPTAEEVKPYLRELLGRGAFSASERHRRFLSYVVQETLEGRANRIKAYNIALAAFDRMEDFDPLTDPIVRIEAARLRRSLQHYYLTAGQADRIRIDIPKGSYAATFTYQEGTPGALEKPSVSTAAAIAWRRSPFRASYSRLRLAALMVAFGMLVGSLAIYAIANHVMQVTPRIIASDQPSLVIAPFEDTGGDPNRAFVARGLTYEVGTALAQLKDVAVFGFGPVRGENAPTADHASDLTLMGSVHANRSSMRVAIFLMDSRTGRFLQSWSFQKDLIGSDLIKAQADVAQQVVASLRKQCVHDAMNGTATVVRRAFDCRPVSIIAD
jgi:adenylate cyclase